MESTLTDCYSGKKCVLAVTLYLAGWGLRHLTSLSGPLLSYEVQVQSVDATECKKLRDDPEKIRFNTFCTIPDDIPDCYADLGSPVYRHDHIFGRLFVGIRTSHSCTKADPVEVYAPMSHYLEWIRKYTTPEFAGKVFSNFMVGILYCMEILYI